MSVKPVNLFPSSDEPALNTQAGLSGPSIIPSSPTYTPSSPCKSLKEIFDGVTSFDVRPNFMAASMKKNGVPITKYESAIFDSKIAKGLADGCLLPRDRVAYSHITD
ncbi:hypothetical protein MKX01_032123 [Papaver californicum]|nr:hypothetical protein MKX01_032123 [Papaver californicum]